ncbi:energy-coupling factor ABC transporter permease [Candidatus Saganbacteria bacterium]|nr:energy-coupling factor ABC transporter permease [Candidatus Saganbacteria bacterium]
MHIPDGLLDPKISTGLISAAIAALSYSLAKIMETITALAPAEVLAASGQGVGNVISGFKRRLTATGERLIYKMGMVGSLIFIAQRCDFPVGGGTSGHLIGGFLAAVILGPLAGTIIMAVVMLAQVIFLKDGGLIALGANIINMAIVGPILGFGLYYLLKKILPEWTAIIIAAWFSVVSAALACALELGLSGALPFLIIIPAMLKIHMVVGAVEALLSLALINIFRIMFKGEA